MRINIWAAVRDSIADLAATGPLKPFWVELLKRPPEDMPKADQAVLSALSGMSDAHALAVLNALARWSGERSSTSAPVSEPVGLQQLRERIADLARRGKVEDMQALDRLLAALVRQKAPPGLLAALKASLTGGDEGVES